MAQGPAGLAPRAGHGDCRRRRVARPSDALAPAIMENWKTNEITLIARDRAGQAERQATVPCVSVQWQPPSDIPPSRDNGTAPGYLVAHGVDAAPLADFSWAPTHVRFQAEGYMEAREFAVTGFEADPDAHTLKLPIP